MGMMQDRPQWHDDCACVRARRRIGAQHLSLELDRQLLVDLAQLNIAHRAYQAIDGGSVIGAARCSLKIAYDRLCE